MRLKKTVTLRVQRGFDIRNKVYNKILRGKQSPRSSNVTLRHTAT